MTQLREQMTIDSEVASQANYASYAMGIQHGAVVGITATLLLLGAAHVIQKLTSRVRVKKKPQAQAAAIGK